MNTIITEEQLLQLGFEYEGEGPDVLPFEEPEDYTFKWWTLQVGNFILSVTTEWNLEGIPIVQYVDIDGTNISKQNLTLQELMQLKNLL